MNSTCILLIFLLGVPLLVSSQLCEHLEIIPHPQWCSAFFLCRFGFWTVLVCPGGLVYDRYNRRCDSPENVECENDPDLTTPEWSSPVWTTRTVTWSTPTITPSVPTFSTPSIPTFSTPSRPTFSTPSVPTFSTPTVPPWITDTTPERPTTPTRTTPSRPTRSGEKNEVISKISCNDSTRPSTLPHSLCQYFYKCINGNEYEMKCAEGMLWNFNQELCDYPQNVTCLFQ